MKEKKFNTGGGNLDKVKSAVKTGLKVAVPLTALLTSFHARAESWVSGNDIDHNPDGSSTGTNINDGSFIWSFGGDPQGVSFREIDDGSGGSIIEMSTDGINFTDITADIKALDPSLAISTIIEVSGYDDNTDTLGIFDFDNGTYWEVSNASNSSTSSATELQGSPCSIGSIDPTTGDFIGTYSHSSDIDPAKFTSSATPSVVYTHSGDDWLPQSDLGANDRLFVSSSSNNIYRVKDVSSGSPTRTAIVSTGDAGPLYYESATKASFGFDMVVYGGSSGELKYVYDSDSGVTVSPDTDGDGINDDIDACITEFVEDEFDTDVDGCIDDVDGDTWKADVDCLDTNAAVYPGAPIVYGDGVDSNCDNTDGPTAPVISINPSTTVELMASVVLSAESSDDEDSTLTYTWTVENSTGTTVDSGSGERRSYTPTAEGTYTVTCVVTDSDEITAESTKTFTVEDNPVYSDLPVVDGPVTDGTYYDGADPEKGWIEVKGVSIEGDKIVLDEFGSSFAVDHYPAFEFSAPDAGVEGVTSDDLVGGDVLGFMAAKEDEYLNSDTTDTTRMLKVTQTEGEQDIEGTFTNADGSLELDEHLKGAVNDAFADVVNDPDEVDTGDTGGDSGDTGEDTGGETGSDTDTGDTHETGNTNDSNDSGNNVEDTEGNVNPPTTCSGCATTDGANGTWALGLAGMALLAKRRRN